MSQWRAYLHNPPTSTAQGVPPFWSTYIAVDDVDAATGRVHGAGGQVLMPPTDVMEAGRMSVVTDPSGAAVGLWQARQHIGATLVNEPGTLIWNELLTDDGEAAYAFYAEVVGLTSELSDMGGNPYTLFKVGDDMVAGSMAPPMEGIPNHWHVYFAVEAMDPALEKARRARGQSHQRPDADADRTDGDGQRPAGRDFQPLRAVRADLVARRDPPRHQTTAARAR